jgi:hypothetical protein
MSRRTALFAAVATIGLSAVYTWVPSTPANAAGPRVVVNAKMKNAAPPRIPANEITRFGWKAQHKTLH